MYPLFLSGSFARNRQTSKKSSDKIVRKKAGETVPVAKFSLIRHPQPNYLLPRAMKNGDQNLQHEMEVPLIIAPVPLPTIGENGHVCLPPGDGADEEESQLLPSSEITNTRVTPFSQCRERILNRRSGQAAPQCETHAQRAPGALSKKWTTQTRAPSNKPAQVPEKHRPPLKPIPTPNPRTKSSLVPTLQKHSTPTTPSKNRASPVRKRTAKHKEEEVTRISPPTTRPKQSSPDRHVHPCPHNNANPKSRKRPMSEQAAETLRIMEWAKEQVRVAEKRAREDERAVYKERAFLLRLRGWEAEMRMRRMLEKDGEMDDEFREVFGMYWIGEVQEMERCRSFVWEKRKRCCRGLAVALEL